MATLSDLKTAVNKILKDNFVKIKINPNDTKEGFKKPAFFTQILPITTEYDTVNFTSNKLMVVINYFSKDGVEMEMLKMYDAIKKAFGMTIKVNQRSFLIQRFRSEIVDGVLQLKFNLDYLVNQEKIDNHELMQELDMKITKE